MHFFFVCVKCRPILEHPAEEPDSDHEFRCVWFSYRGATWLYLLTISNEAIACRRQRRAIIRTHPLHKVCQTIVFCYLNRFRLEELLLNPKLPCPTVSLCVKPILGNYCCRGKGWCPSSSLFSWIIRLRTLACVLNVICHIHGRLWFCECATFFMDLLPIRQLRYW
jgi:hypothetical protein